MVSDVDSCISRRTLLQSYLSLQFSFNVSLSYAVVFTLATFASFIASNTNLSFSNQSYGFAAVVMSLVTNFISLILLITDKLLPECSEKMLTYNQRQLLFASNLFIWTSIIGTIMIQSAEKYHKLGNWEAASQFSLCTLLTIGYGTYVPVTDAGKIITIIFSFFGFLVMAFYILSFENRIIKDAKDVEYNDEQRTTENYTGISLVAIGTGNTFNSTQSTRGYSLTEFGKTIFEEIYSVTFILVFWLVSAAIFSRLESWRYIDGLYFAYITMTGIGYGDFVTQTAWGVEYWHYFIYLTVFYIYYRCQFLHTLSPHLECTSSQSFISNRIGYSISGNGVDK